MSVSRKYILLIYTVLNPTVPDATIKAVLTSLNPLDKGIKKSLTIPNSTHENIKNGCQNDVNCNCLHVNSLIINNLTLPDIVNLVESLSITHPQLKVGRIISIV